MHPIAVLVAMKTYAQGRGMKGSGKWTPVTRVVDALDKAFYLSFENAPTTGKRVMEAMLKMKKLDIAELKRAHDGELVNV